MEDLLGIKNINCHSELDSESINLMDNKELALIDSGSESGMTRGRGKCVITPPEFLSSQCSLRNSALPVQGGRKFTKAAFTLAEVLITLGIIGVVAAMTIPNLIANVRSHQYRSAFKKAVSTLSQAARMSEAQYGFDYAGISEQCGSGQNAAKDNPEEKMSICAILNGTLTGATYYPNLSNIRVNKKSVIETYSITGTHQLITGKVGDISTAFRAYVLADGTIVGIYIPLGTIVPCSLDIGNILTFNSDDRLEGCLGFVDVNGVSLPNKEVSCSSGSHLLSQNNCIVKNDAQHMTDVYPIRFHDGIVEPATAAARYVLKTAK